MAQRKIEPLPIHCKAILSIEEATEYMSMGRDRLKKLIMEDPTFPATREGSIVRICRKALDDWLVSRAKRRVGFPQFAR